MPVVLAVIHHSVFGGPHNQILRLARPLADRGWNTVVVLPAEPGNAARRLREAGVEVLQTPLHRPRMSWRPQAHLGLICRAWPEVQTLRRIIRERNASLVQVFGPLYPHGAVAARLEGVPVVWQLLGTFAPAPIRFGMMPVVLYLSDVVMTTGRAVAKAHPGTGWLGPRLIPFYPPVDCEEFRPDSIRRARAREELGVPSDAVLIGTVGNLNRIKGHDTLVRVASEVRKCAPQTYFRILGAGTPTHAAYYEAHVRRPAARLRLLEGNGLAFVDPGNRVADFLPALDIFVLPSRSEGIPTSVLEAMACGLPVIAHNVGALGEVIEKGTTGYLVPRDDPQPMVKAILDLVDNPGLRRTLGTAARQRAVDRFDTEVCAQAHQAAFDLATTWHAGRVNAPYPARAALGRNESRTGQ